MRRCGFEELGNHGELLLRFLHFYGYEFDYSQVSVSIGNVEGFIKRNDNAGVIARNENRGILSIKDPLCPSKSGFVWICVS